ncbi:MAG: class I SAM-dependent methyltransferase [Flavobacteriales bacterium]
MRDRLENEKAFHNESFSQGVRKSIDEYYTIFRQIRKDFSDRIIAFVPNKNVIECGCGVSTFSPEFAPLANSLLGIDISDEAVRQSKEKADNAGLTNCEFKVMNAEDLKVEDNSVSLIFGSGIIHHLDLDVFYKEAERVLDSKGKIIFMEPLGHNPFINFYRWITPKMRTPDEHPLLRKDLKQIAKHFKVVNIKYYYFFSMAAIPFRRTRIFGGMLNTLDAVDQFFFSCIPYFKYMAWYVLIDASNPKSK